MAPSNAPFPEVNATLFQNKILPTLRHHNGAQSHVKFSRVGEISTFDGIGVFKNNSFGFLGYHKKIELLK